MDRHKFIEHVTKNRYGYLKELSEVAPEDIGAWVEVFHSPMETDFWEKRLEGLEIDEARLLTFRNGANTHSTMMKLAFLLATALSELPASRPQHEESV